MTHREPGPWEDRRDAEPGPRPAARADDLRVTFVGHASVLVQIAGQNVLTDPLWAERASPVSFAGPKRHRPPGIRFEDLPPIDLVLVSHDHYDHLSLPTLRRIAKEHPGARMVTGLGNRPLIESIGAREVSELDWWESVDVDERVRATFVPAQHFSGRGIGDRDTTLWGGFVVETPVGSLYFAGDTGMGPHFRQIRERIGAPRVALLPIGAYRPAWFMRRVHVCPSEAVEAARILDASTSVAIHFGTFRLADDGMDEPVRDLRAALDALGEKAPRFWVLEEGEGRDVPRLAAFRSDTID
jgi:L-ascorbate metabolism protein UlaG (beta-lactamase superfamily)